VHSTVAVEVHFKAEERPTWAFPAICDMMEG